MCGMGHFVRELVFGLRPLSGQGGARQRQHRRREGAVAAMPRCWGA